MMSATPAFTETPVAAPAAGTGPAPLAAPNNGAPSDFQNLLAGAAATLQETGDTLTPQAMAALLNARAAAAAKTAAVGSLVECPAPPTESPDMLQLLVESTGLLPEAGSEDSDGSALELAARDKDSDEDRLSEWLDIMLPPMYAVPTSGGGADAGGESLASQEDATPNHSALRAMVAERGAGADGKTLDALAPMVARDPGMANHVSQVASGPTPAAFSALVTQVAADASSRASQAVHELTAGHEAVDEDSDSWMNSLSDVNSRRAQHLAPESSGRIAPPVQDPRWAEALAQRVLVMARDGESLASLRLTPQELGPLEIQISVRDDQATVHFGAAHQETRSALEAALPKLREMLSAQGLQLANASVSQQSPGGGRADKPTAGSGVGAVAEESGEKSAVRTIATSLLDIYA